MENSLSGDGFLSSNQYILDQGNNTDDSNHEPYKNTPLREQDRFLPIANITKIMKRAIPDSGKVKIAKDAREIIQECVSEFISFITSEASDRCHSENRKTINGEDILFAMTQLGFDNYIEPLKLYLQKYREMTLNGLKLEKAPSTAESPYTVIQEEKLKGPQISSMITEIEPQTGPVVFPSTWDVL